MQIVAFCIGHGKDYGLTAETYKVSYQQIYFWVRKYEEAGVNGLADRRGKAKPKNELTEAERLRQENKILQAKLKDKEMEIALLKTEGAERRRLVSGVRQEGYYIAIRYLHGTEKYSVRKLCAAVGINRSSYYKWMKRKASKKQLENEEIIS